MKQFAILSTLCSLAALLSACKPDCRETVRTADFEVSQNNYARAEKLYAQAWAEDSLSCPDAREKRERALRFQGR